MKEILPRNTEAERALLASLLTDPDQFFTIGNTVTAGSFYATKHQQIFRAIAALVAENKPVDAVTVCDQLSRDGCEPMSAYIAELAGLMPTGQLAEYYARIVKEKHARRLAIAALAKAMEAARGDAKDILDVIATVQKELDQVLPADDRNAESSIFPEIVIAAERVLDIPKGGKRNFIETGFPDLDRELNLTNGTLTIIGASPRVGKTSLILCVIRNMARAGKKPLLFTLEMTRQRVLENLIAQEAGVCYRDMISGYLSDEDSDKVYGTVKKWPKMKISVLDGQWSAAGIRHRAIQEKRKGGLDAIFVDVLGKLLPPDGLRSSDLHRIFNQNCQLLQDLAIELCVPVILTAHLNRDAARQGEGRPNLFSLREAGEEFSDNVLLIHRPYLNRPTPDNKDLAEVIIAKNRDGDVGTIELGFDGPRKSFYGLAKGYQVNDDSDYWWKGD